MTERGHQILYLNVNVSVQGHDKVGLFHSSTLKNRQSTPAGHKGKRGICRNKSGV
jgi:hypothetical protein